MTHKPTRETKEDYYYNLPKNKYFILRKLSGQWTHFYPPRDLEYPRSFASEKAAKRYMSKPWSMLKGSEVKIVSGSSASKYPVPKRF